MILVPSGGRLILRKLPGAVFKATPARLANAFPVRSGKFLGRRERLDSLLWMRLRTRPCSNCGAPLQAGWATRTIECSHCHTTVTVEDDVVMARGFQRARADQELPIETPEVARVSLADVPYRVLGRLGRGESSDAFFAERAHRVTERVVLKVLRAAGDEDLLEAEWRVLTKLRQSEARGAEHFLDLVPQPIAHGALVHADGSRGTAMALRFPTGFVHSAEDVRRAHPGGLDPRHAVWLWRRLLELLGFLHESGVVHGALLPRHVLIHARDHGARLVGYSCAGEPGAALRGTVTADHAHYPRDVHPHTPLSVALDLNMSARVVLRALGNEPGVTRAPTRVPARLSELLERTATMPVNASTDARAFARTLHGEVTEAAREAFGEPRYLVLQMKSA